MDTLLLEVIKKRASCKETQTDFAKWGCPDLPPPASHELVWQVEQMLECTLWHDHFQVLTTIANGYFGPGDGLLHVLANVEDDDEHSLINMAKRIYFENEKILLVCDWGSGIGSYIDCETGQILSITEYGIVDSGFNFADFLEKWAQGIDLFSILFDFSKETVIDSKSGREVTIRRFKGGKGLPYKGLDLGMMRPRS